MGKAEYKKAKAIAAESPQLLGKWIDVSLNDADSPFGSTYQLEKSALKDLYHWKKSGDMAHAHRLMSDILRNLQELSEIALPGVALVTEQKTQEQSRWEGDQVLDEVWPAVVAAVTELPASKKKPGPKGPSTKKVSLPTLKDIPIAVQFGLWCQRQAPFLFAVYYSIFTSLKWVPKLTINLILIIGLVMGLWIILEAEDFGEQLSSGLSYLPGLMFSSIGRVWTGLRRKKHCKQCLPCAPCVCPDCDQVFDFTDENTVNLDEPVDEMPPAAPPFGPFASAMVASFSTYIASHIWGANAAAAAN